MEVFVPTVEIVLIEIAIGGILGGIIRPIGWAVSLVSLIGFFVSAYFFLDLNPDAIKSLSSTEMSEKLTVFIIGSVNFLLHTALFDTGAIIVNRLRASFSTT